MYKHLVKWERPDCYAGPEYREYYHFLSRNRDSSILENCNFNEGLKMLGGESESVIVIRDRHWLVGWIEFIYIHESDKESLDKADSILERISIYPILNEEKFTEMEEEIALDVWKKCYNWKERIDYIRENESQFEFSNYIDLIQNVRGMSFIGYASELVNR